jgi:hypothetical protein
LGLVGDFVVCEVVVCGDVSFWRKTGRVALAGFRRDGGAGLASNSGESNDDESISETGTGVCVGNTSLMGLSTGRFPLRDFSGVCVCFGSFLLSCKGDNKKGK